MTAYTFPAEAFVVEGEPDAVREVSRGYGRFASTAGQAAADLRGLDRGTWIGSEGDRFRDRVAELPPHLDTARGAFAQVARALEGFADALVVAQGRMGGVRADAEQTWSRLRAAQDGQDRSRVARLEEDLDGQLSAAAGLRGQVLAAAQQAAQAIRAAGRASPTAGQSWLADRWEKTRSWAAEQVDRLKGWVAEHAEGLRSVAKALRVVGVALVAVGAVLAVLGVGGGVLAAGFLLWGAGDVLDATVDWAEGRISGRELLVSAGLTVGLGLVGGGAAAKLGAGALGRLARTGLPAGAGGRLPQDMHLVKRIAAQAGVGLDGVKVRIHKSAPRQGMFGQTTPDGILHLYPNAFRNEEELVKTLGHERTHVWQVKTHGYPTAAERQVYEDAAKATEAQWWDYYRTSRTP